MTILIAGFSAFPGAPVNPTERLVESLSGTATPGGDTVSTVVLPVSWTESWPRLRAAIDVAKPAAVLLFGLSLRCERLHIEMLARNHRQLGRADASGAFPSGPAVLDGPEQLPVRIPIAATATALRLAGLDFAWSKDAGTYLCNDTLYRLAFHADALGIDRFGFVHSPLTDELVDSYLVAEQLPSLVRTVPEHTLAAAAAAIIGAWCD
ncbi:hypothetical protein [Mangrovicella endophytica]|uniref:pyroglutamyl-peptidase I family protein n=1 Tax=Mangrovicella endophytica TaxID=2066697 RepID=UPI000C9DF5F2|nr:hypothetical protein [Mangrovicella endophytica]